MRRKSIIHLITIASLSATLLAGGCRPGNRHRTAPESGAAAERIAPSDAAVGAVGDKAEANSIVDPGDRDVDFAEREEIRRSYTLKPGARVRISNINGKVDVEATDINHAEVLIIRSARKRDDLQFRQLNIEHEPNLLNIRVENDRKSLFSALGGLPEGRQRVILRLPRKVELAVHGTNGNITVGELDGSIEINGVNGEVKVARVAGGTELHGINGNIAVTIAKLSTRGVEASGVNGNIELRFADEVNAEIDMGGINGNITPDLPGFVAQGEHKRGRLEGRVGSGGPHIEVHGVNGNVSLLKATPSETTARAGAGKAAVK